MFIKSRINKVDESYRSPFSNEFFPVQISNTFIPMNVTKVEKSLNALISEYCRINYLGPTVSSVFFSDFNTSHVLHFIIRRELQDEGGPIKRGFYQTRICLEIEAVGYRRSGYLEFDVELEDCDGSRRHIQGQIFRDDDKKPRAEKALDIKNYNYKDSCSLFSKMESNFYQTFVASIIKMRPSMNSETTHDRERMTNRQMFEKNNSIIDALRVEIERKPQTSNHKAQLYTSLNSAIFSTMNKQFSGSRPN
jgi:F-actin capping protein, beta subunit